MLLYDKIEEVYVAQKLSDQLNLVHVAGKNFVKEETKANKRQCALHCYVVFLSVGVLWFRARIVGHGDVTRPEPDWRGAQWDLSQLSSSSHIPEPMKSIPTTSCSSADIPIIKYNVAHQSALSVNSYMYGPPRLAPPTQRPLMNFR